uniref:Uncharacterized protein n=1 Tax=Arundo donax TaxID=35708 RepID=A0A0A9G8Z0_ARUDO
MFLLNQPYLSRMSATRYLSYRADLKILVSLQRLAKCLLLLYHVLLQTKQKNVTMKYYVVLYIVNGTGHVDNNFIDGYCRKIFEDKHPGISKHYFYPNVGECLLRYSTSSDVQSVKHSFPDVLFAVDLHKKVFTFMDSIFGEKDDFQIYVRNRLR